jgi:hypothetical protein
VDGISADLWKVPQARNIDVSGRLFTVLKRRMSAVLEVLNGEPWIRPLNQTFPIDRTRLMVESSMCRSVIVDAGSEPQLR